MSQHPILNRRGQPLYDLVFPPPPPGTWEARVDELRSQCATYEEFYEKLAKVPPPIEERRGRLKEQLRLIFAKHVAALSSQESRARPKDRKLAAAIRQCIDRLHESRDWALEYLDSPEWGEAFASGWERAVHEMASAFFSGQALDTSEQSPLDQLASVPQAELEEHMRKFVETEAQGATVTDEAELQTPPTTRKEQQAFWLAKAMLLVRDHPGWSDAEIAQRVDRHRSTLSRNPAYQAAAGMARGSRGDRPAGHVTHDPDTGLYGVEAYSDQDDPATKDWDDD